MSKYSFYQLRSDAKNGKPLPGDINDFVSRLLEKIGFGDVCKVVEKKQKHLHYGQLNVHSTSNPSKRIEISFRCGIITHLDMIEDILTIDGIVCVDIARIKNPKVETNKTMEVHSER